MNQPPDITPRNSIGSFRLNKLQQLEKANAELTERNQRYELLCIQLQNDVKFLKDQIKNNPSESFETDEEELQKEIGRFDEQMHTPIFVDKVANIKPLFSLLTEYVPEQFTLKTLRNDQVKIQPKTYESHRKIIEELEKKETEFHTYKPKNERGFKVILRNMHPSADTQLLKEELLSHGHNVTNIWSIKKRGTNESLPLFEIELSTKPNNKDIYSVTKLMSCIIKFEAPRPKKQIPQCSNCQQYNVMTKS